MLGIYYNPPAYSNVIHGPYDHVHSTAKSRTSVLFNRRVLKTLTYRTSFRNPDKLIDVECWHTNNSLIREPVRHWSARRQPPEFKYAVKGFIVMYSKGYRLLTYTSIQKEDTHNKNPKSWHLSYMIPFFFPNL